MHEKISMGMARLGPGTNFWALDLTPIAPLPCWPLTPPWAFPPTHKQHDGHGHNEIINGHKHAWENCDVHVHDDNDNDCQTNHDSMLLSSMLLGPSLWALEPTHGPCSQFPSIQAMLAHSACTIHLIRGGPLSPTSSGQHHLPKHWTAILGYQKGCPSHHHTHHTLTHTHTMWAAWPSQAQASQPGIQHMVAHPRSELLWEGNDLPSQCQESTRGGVGQGWGLSLFGGGGTRLQATVAPRA